nr:dihydrofolate reductase [Eubacterium sp.]
MQINMIVAVDEAWGIGYENQLLFHIKEDMRQFKEKTMGNVVVMGRKTLESLPGGRPLPGRINIVLTKNYADELRQMEDVLVATDLEDVRQLVKDVNKDVYVIGGEQIYKTFLSYAERIYMTKVYDRKRADAYFPNVEEDKEWVLVHEGERKQEGEVIFSFMVFEKK